MKTLQYILSIVLVLTTCALADAPKWFTTGKHNAVDPSTHIFGMGEGNSFDEAEERAGADMAAKIEVQIEAQSETVISSVIEGDHDRIQEAFSSATKSFTSVKIRGAEIIDKEKDGDDHYVLMAVKKDVFLRDLKSELEQKEAVIEQVRANSHELLKQGDVFKAIDVLMDTEELVAELLTRISLYNAFSPKAYDAQSMAGASIISEARTIINRVKMDEVSGNRQMSKQGFLLPEPLVTRLYFDDNDEGIPKARLKLKDEEGKTIERQYTDEDGKVEFYAYAVGTDKGRYTVSLDLRKVPKLFRDDLQGLEETFKYEIAETTPLKFAVEITDEGGSRVEEVEQTIEKSILKLGHNIDKDADFKLAGNVRVFESNTIDGFSGKMYQVKSEIDLFLKSVDASKSYGSITIDAKGVDKESEQRAAQSANKKFKIKSRDMSKLLAKAAPAVDKVNAKKSEQEFAIGKELFEKKKYKEAISHLSQVTSGDKLESARQMITEIKKELSTD